MNLGGATVAVDNELNGDKLETTNQTVGIKGTYGTMSYGLGWKLMAILVSASEQALAELV